MTVVTTLDVYGMSPTEYRAVMDRLGVERRPEAGIYLHATITTDFGYRIVEIWDRKEGFEDFLEKRLAPATKALGIDRKTEITRQDLGEARAIDEVGAAGRGGTDCEVIGPIRFGGPAK